MFSNIEQACYNLVESTIRGASSPVNTIRIISYNFNEKEIPNNSPYLNFRVYFPTISNPYITGGTSRVSGSISMTLITPRSSGMRDVNLVRDLLGALNSTSTPVIDANGNTVSSLQITGVRTTPDFKTDLQSTSSISLTFLCYYYNQV